MLFCYFYYCCCFKSVNIVRSIIHCFRLKQGQHKDKSQTETSWISNSNNTLESSNNDLNNIKKNVVKDKKLYDKWDSTIKQ